MIQLATLVLVIWPAVVFFIFERHSAAKAIVVAFVAGWLFLPPMIIGLPGVPDWSKMTATVVSVTLCICLKYPQRLLGVRPRWFDAPVIAFCTIPIAASVSNAQGIYDGLSGSLDEVFRWGLPYWIGRAFLGDAGGNRQLCLGVAVGGFLYAPLCLFEIRMSPQIMQRVYGMSGGAIAFGLRYGGYRPMVFLATGLELGWWMCCATMSAFLLWRSGNVRRLWGYPMGALTAVLSVITVGCKATGALLQIAVGFAIILASRRLNKSMLFWALIAVGPIYCLTRSTGLWSGESFVAWTETLFGADRAESIAFRFANEEVLTRNALQRPIFGWARAGGFNMPDANGRTAVTDGYWIIVFGWMGLSGLAALNVMLLLPSARFLTRFRPSSWLEPAVAPLTAFAILLPLFMMDNLSNAMLNPIYAIAMGALAGATASRDRAAFAVAPARAAGSFAHRGGPLPFAPTPSRGGSPRDLAADFLEAAAAAAADDGRWDDALAHGDAAVRARRAALGTARSDERIDRLARSHVAYAQLLMQMGDPAAARRERERAREAWTQLEANGGLLGEALGAHAANLNDLAWRLLQDHAEEQAQVDRAIDLAEEALRIDPEQPSAWNTLGLARYRRGDHHRAIHALAQAVGRSGAGGNAFDFYYLSLANLALGYRKPAADWLTRAEAWERAHPPWSNALREIREEASRAINTS